MQDPAGRRIGFNPATGQVINEIGGGAEYSGANSEPQVIAIFPGEFLRGGYHVTGIGTGTGPYSVTLLVNGEDATGLIANRQIASGIATAGAPIAPLPSIDFASATIRLSFERLPDGLLLHWPAKSTGKTLLHSSDLTHRDWAIVPGADPVTKTFSTTKLVSPVELSRLERR